jgi:hypothetical protein
MELTFRLAAQARCKATNILCSLHGLVGAPITHHAPAEISLDPDKWRDVLHIRSHRCGSGGVGNRNKRLAQLSNGIHQ